MQARADWEAVRDRTASLLRDVLEGRELSERELLASYALAYARAYLLSCSAHWRFGFSLPASEAAAEASHLCVAELLQEPPGGWETSVLARGLQAVGVREASRDEALRLALQRLLRKRSRQCLQHIWRQEHRQEARLLRRLKDHVRRGRGVRLIRDARGQFVAARGADLRRRPIGREELERRWREARAAWESGGLTEVLAGEGTHGGYCYLLDLVHVIHAERIAQTLSSPPGPAGEETPADATRWLAEITDLACEVARRQESKYHRRLSRGRQAHDAGPGHGAQAAVRIRADVAVEMVARRFSLGRPDWEGCSQRQLLLGLLPETCSEGCLDRWHSQTDYIVRCLLQDLRSGRVRRRLIRRARLSP